VCYSFQTLKYDAKHQVRTIRRKHMIQQIFKNRPEKSSRENTDYLIEDYIG
jgi:hypothetical protein